MMKIVKLERRIINNIKFLIITLFRRKIYKEQYSGNTKKPILPITILLFVFVIGSLGYYFIWFEQFKGSIVDAVYMTVITITTLGYMEVHPLNDAGRIFTMILAIVGIGSLFYILTTIMENLVNIEINQFRKKRKMVRKIESLKNHIILVGFGRVGQLAAKELLETTEDFVVIDNDFAEDDMFNQKEYLLTITGDATNDDILLLSGIERARAMILATGDAATTVFVTLSARVLNPKLFLIVRSDDYHDREKLIRAGADKIVNPYSIGGQTLVNLVLKPHVVDFFETNLGTNSNIKIESIEISENSNWVGKSLIELDIRKESGASILAIIRNDKPIINPDSNFIIQKSDKVLAFGYSENLEILENSALVK